MQINGEDVENREQALKLFSEQKESLTLLVCRPQYQLDDCLLERGNTLLDELQMDMLEQTHQEAMQYTAFHHYQTTLTQDDDGRTDTTGTTENNSIHHEKDSGVGRATDESVRNDSDGGEDGSTRKYPLSMNSGDLRYSNESFTSNELVEHELHGCHGLSVEDCQKFQAALESKCDKHVRSDTDESYQGKESKVMRLGSDSMDTTSQSGDSLNRPAKLVEPESEDKIDSLIESTKSPEEDVWLHKSKPGVSPSLSTGSSISDVNVLTDVLTDVTSMSSTVSGPLDSNKLGSPKRKHSEKVVDDDDSSHISLLDKTQRKTSQGSASRQHRAPRTVPGSPGHRSKSSSSSRERQRSSSSSGSSKDKAKENKDKVPLEKNSTSVKRLAIPPSPLHQSSHKGPDTQKEPLPDAASRECKRQPVLSKFETEASKLFPEEELGDDGLHDGVHAKSPVGPGIRKALQKLHAPGQAERREPREGGQQGEGSKREGRHGVEGEDQERRYQVHHEEDVHQRQGPQGQREQTQRRALRADHRRRGGQRNETGQVLEQGGQEETPRESPRPEEAEGVHAQSEDGVPPRAGRG